MIQSQFGLKPNEQTYMYRRPYPEWYVLVALPSRYRIRDFSKFSRQEGISTMEHISRFIAQLGEASLEDAHRVRFFPLSLSGLIFTLFSSLEPNSIIGCVDLEKKFYKYFYTVSGEMRITDLTNKR